MAVTTKAPDAAKGEDFMTLLRRLRKSKGLNQTELAKRLKLKTPSTVSLWESGHTTPSEQMIPKLARVLEIDPLELTRVIWPETPTNK